MNKILILIISIIFISCQRHYTDNEVILEAEKILDNSPDSAFNLLRSIRNPQRLSTADYAAWCLQYTHACYKLQKEFTSDSIIRVSVNYYRHSKLKKQSGTAFYLLGCVSELLCKKKEAMEAYKEAEKILSLTEEYKLKGLIAFNMGYVSMYEEAYNNSLRYFRQSCQYFKQCNNKKYLAYAYSRISNIFNQLDFPYDSVMYYTDLALEASQSANDSINYYTILSRKGELLYKKDYKQAKELILKGYDYFPTKKNYYSAYLSYIFLKLNRPDSAKYYINIALSKSYDLPSKLIALHSAALIFEESKDYKQAYFNLEKGYLLRDSIYAQNISDQLHRIDKQYDLTQKEIENKSLKIANQTKVIWIISLAISFLIVLVLFLLFRSKSKQKQAEDEMEKQRLRFSKETVEIQNRQKRELLKLKTQSKIGNTLSFNRLNKSLLALGKMEQFLQEITKQSTLSEKDWPVFIQEVDNLFDSRISKLKTTFNALTDTDCVVIALICLEISIPDSCILLNMNKNTLYNRRKTIKIRLGLDANTDLEKWIVDYMSDN